VKAICAILLVVGTLAVVSSLVVTLITTYPVTTGIFALVTIGTVLLEKQ
jgi:hypothetical protein